MSTENQVLEIVAATSEQPRRLYEFGPFRVDPSERLLLRGGLPVAVTSKVFDTLLFLIQRHNHLVEKSELMQAVWTDSFVEESNLAVTISMLRKALGDEGAERKYIQTVSKRGYRFIGDVRELTPEPAQSISTTATPIPLEPESRRRRRPALLVSSLGTAVIVILAVTILAVRSRSSHSSASTAIKSLAVLPFQALTPGATPDYLGLGIADAVITKLGNTGEIVVRSTTAVTKYQQDRGDPLAMGREQKVDAILSGHIEALPNRLRVNVQLVRVADGSVLWADTFDQSPQHIFDLEDEVARGAAQAMAVRLSGGAKMRLARRETRNSDAYELYLEGRYLWSKASEGGLRQSIDLFQRATERDPQYAQAYAGLADAYEFLGVLNLEPDREAFRRAREAALKALQLDDSLSEAHTSLGLISFYYDWDWQQAEKEFRRAIALNPNYPVAHDWYALRLAALGHSQEAIDEVLRAEELDPLSFLVNTHVGRVNFLARRYDQAIEAYRKVIELEPGFERARMRLGMVYAAQGDYARAIREFQEARQLSAPDVSYLDGLEGYAEALSGDKVAARKLLAQLIERSRTQPVPAYSMALIHLGLGERDSALAWLERSYDERSTYIVYAKVDPLLDPVRSDPRFAQLLQKMGL